MFYPCRVNAPATEPATGLPPRAGYWGQQLRHAGRGFTDLISLTANVILLFLKIWNREGNPMKLRGLMGWAVPLALLAGCASNPKHQAIKADLKDVPSSAEVVTVPNHLSYKLTGAFGKTTQVNLLPGTYHLQWENKIGRFYTGERYCVWWKLGDDFVLVPGGVWVPRDSLDAPRFYYFTGHGQVVAKSLDEVVAKRPAPASADPTIAVTGVAVNTILNSPAPVSPAAGGLGAGIAATLVAGTIGEHDHIAVYGEPLPESVDALRAGVRMGK